MTIGEFLEFYELIEEMLKSLEVEYPNNYDVIMWARLLLEDWKEKYDRYKKY